MRILRRSIRKGVVCLTGDVHHMSMKGKSHQYLPPRKTEAELALEYLQIAKEYGVKVTLFATGKLFLEEWTQVKKWLQFENLEIGGHTFQALTPLILHWGFFRYIYNSPWGPAFIQRRDVNKTLSVIKKKTGYKVIAWRNHAYACDKNTPKILSKFGIKIWSDEKSRKLLPYKINNNLWSLPINVMPDHEHLIHAHIKKYKKNWPSDAFGNKCYKPEEWLNIVKEQIREIVELNGVATLLVHPICMYIVDRFYTFRELCKFLAQYRTLKVSEILEWING